MRQKITYFTIDFPPDGGGMSRHSFDVTTALSSMGYEVTVVAPSTVTGSQEQFVPAEGISVRRLKPVRSGHIFDNYIFSVISFFAAGLRLLSSGRVKALAANTWSVSGVAAYLLSRVTGVPYFIFAHGYDVASCGNGGLTGSLKRAVIEGAAVVIANSGFTKTLVKASAPGASTVVVNPCVDLKRFGDGHGPDISRDSGERVILTVGRMVESKGHDTVIRAIPEVIRSFPEARYYIAGDGVTRGACEELADKLGIADNVIFAGEIGEDELIRNYRASEIFIMTSRYLRKTGEVEGFGIVFLEAGACGKPVIGSRSGGIPDAVIDGVTGLLVEECDVKGVAGAIIRLLSDGDLRKRLGENGKKRVVGEMGMDSFTDKLKAAVDAYIK